MLSLIKTLLNLEMLFYGLIIYSVICVIRYIICLFRSRKSIIFNQLDICTGIFGTMGSGKDLLQTHIVRIYDKQKKQELKDKVNQLNTIKDINPHLKQQFNYYYNLYKNKKSYVYSNIPYHLYDKNYSYINCLNSLALHTHEEYTYLDGDMIAISEAGLIFPSTDYKNLDKQFYSIEYLVKLIRHMFNGTFLYNDQHPNRVWVSIREKTARFIQIKERKEILTFPVTRFIIKLICYLPLPKKFIFKLYKFSDFLRSLSWQSYILDCYENSEDYNTDLSVPDFKTKGRAWHVKYCFRSRTSYNHYDTRAFEFVGKILTNEARVNSYLQVPTFEHIFLTEDNLFKLGYKRLTDILSNNYKKNI